MDALRAMSSDIEGLDSRLHQLASTLAPSPSHHAAHSSAHQAASHEEPLDAVERYLSDTLRALQPSDGHRGATTSAPPATGAQVVHGMRELRSTVRRLDKVFDVVATGDRQRQLAATKLAMLVRAFLVRHRFARLQSALGGWRSRRTAGFLAHIARFSAREEFLNDQIARMQAERTSRWLRRVFAELRDVMLLLLPLRGRQRDETARRFEGHQRARLHAVFLPWKAAALGPRSRKRAAADSRGRHIAARQRLEALGRFDVVTPEMVHEEFLKDNVRTIRARHPTHVLRLCFRTILSEVFWPARRRVELAANHARCSSLRRVWRAWLPVFRVQQADKAMIANEGGGGQVATLERFDKPVNLRRLDAHYRRAMLRSHLRAWRRYCSLLRRVRALFETTTRSSLAARMRRWLARADYQRELRANAVEEWRAYCRRVFQTPFRHWVIFATARRARHESQRRICEAYARRQRRQIKYGFFRLWKHLSLFGNVEGVHSKIHLLRSLEDQKRMCLGLERNAELYRDNIAALQQSIRQLEDKMMVKQQELAELHETTQASRFALHAAEQTVARVQGMLEAVRHVHPGTVARIDKLFADTPLLSQDLAEVLKRHEAARTALLSQIVQDEDELEVQTAAGRGHFAREDQLLLRRVKWVLSRLDLGAADKDNEVGNNQSQETTETVRQLCALFEFVRDGDSRALAPDNNPKRGLSGAFGGLNLAALASASASGNSDIVRRRDLLEQTDVWHGFLRAVSVKFVPDAMLSVKERLVRRAVDMDEEIEALKANPHIYNLYRYISPLFVDGPCLVS